MKNKIFFLLLITVLLFTVTMVSLILLTNQSNTKAQINSSENNTPKETVKLFFDVSSKGNFEGVKFYVCPYPEIYLLCIYETAEQCKDKKATIKSQGNHSKSEQNVNYLRGGTFGNPEVSLIVKRMSDGISGNKVKLKSIIDEWTDNNEARVRVNIEMNELSTTKDILLFKQQEKWQIFEFIEENERMNFASPNKSNKK